MKTVKFSILFIAAALLTNVAFATGNLKVNVAPAGESSAMVEITNTKMSTYEIDIKDESGEIIFSKMSKEPAADYKKAYDFSVLEDGTYYMTVAIDNERVDNKLVITDGLVKLYDQKKMIEPFFTYEDQKFKMSYLNFHGGEMNLYVYKNDDRIIGKSIDPAFTIHEGLDFSKADRGLYSVVFVSGDRIFSYELEK